VTPSLSRFNHESFFAGLVQILPKIYSEKEGNFTPCDSFSATDFTMIVCSLLMTLGLNIGITSLIMENQRIITFKSQSILGQPDELLWE